MIHVAKGKSHIFRRKLEERDMETTFALAGDVEAARVIATALQGAVSEVNQLIHALDMACADEFVGVYSKLGVKSFVDQDSRRF